MSIRTLDPCNRPHASNSPSNAHTHANKVIDFLSHKNQRHQAQQQRIVRISPEYDGTCILYSNNKIHSDKLFSMKVLCWGIDTDGDIVGMVPWLNHVIPCTELQDPKHGYFEGYYDAATEEIFNSPPPHKAVELEAAVKYLYDDLTTSAITNATMIRQEIPDNIGTHALLNADDNHSIILTEVISWRLLDNGEMQAMIIAEDEVKTTPVLPGDDCLYPAAKNDNFRYFFQHHVANQIKAEDPEALAAIGLLFEGE